MSDLVEREGGLALLAGLAASALVLAVSLVVFDLLYLSVPAGWTPTYGHALGLAAAVGPSWPVPLPRWSLTPGAFRGVALLLLGAMWGAYLVALGLIARLRQRAGTHAPALRLVVLGALVMNFGLVLVPPALSRDVYHYALFGRMILEQGLNPYLTAGDALRGDPLWALASWTFVSTHYGPVFTLLSVAAVALGGGAPTGTAIAFKLLAALATGASAWAIHQLAREEREDDDLGPLVLFAFCPLVLLESAGNGHNETLMLAPALLGWLLIRRGRLGPGFLLLMLSVHIKWVTLAMAGLVALACLKEAASHRARLRVLALLLATALVSTVVLYAPFWTGWQALHTTFYLVTAGRSVSGGGARGGMGLPGVLAFAAIAAGAVVMVWRQGQRAVLITSATVSLAFVLFVFSWWFPWYLIPALGLLAVGPRAAANRALLLVCLFGAAALMAQWATLLPGAPAN